MKKYHGHFGIIPNECPTKIDKLVFELAAVEMTSALDNISKFRKIARLAKQHPVRLSDRHLFEYPFRDGAFDGADDADLTAWAN